MIAYNDHLRHQDAIESEKFYQDLKTSIAPRELSDAMRDELCAEIDTLRSLMREARYDFHGKAVLFSSDYLSALDTDAEDTPKPT